MSSTSAVDLRTRPAYPSVTRTLPKPATTAAAMRVPVQAVSPTQASCEGRSWPLRTCAATEMAMANDTRKAPGLLKCLTSPRTRHCSPIRKMLMRSASPEIRRFRRRTLRSNLWPLGVPTARRYVRGAGNRGASGTLAGNVRPPRRPFRAFPQAMPSLRGVRSSQAAHGRTALTALLKALLPAG